MCVCVCVSVSLWLWLTVSMWQDIDDALHVRALPNGNFEVGVHIADVGHFVIHNSAMDKEAADRSNTTYLVDRRLDMLPVRRPSPLLRRASLDRCRRFECACGVCRGCSPRTCALLSRGCVAHGVVRVARPRAHRVT